MAADRLRVGEQTVRLGVLACRDRLFGGVDERGGIGVQPGAFSDGLIALRSYSCRSASTAVRAPRKASGSLSASSR